MPGCCRGTTHQAGFYPEPAALDFGTERKCRNCHQFDPTGTPISNGNPRRFGLLFLATQTFSDFRLKLEFQFGRIDDNSGIFVRFRNPRLPVPDRNLPGVSFPYNNQAFIGVDTGFEVQIDELARGNPDGLDEHRTGAVYGILIGPNPGQQDYRRGPGLVPGQWSTYEIEVRGNTYVVRLNGQQTTTFTNTDPFKGKAKITDSDSGYIGIQSHTGRLKFRNVQVMELQPALVVGPCEIAAAKKVAPMEISVEEQ